MAYVILLILFICIIFDLSNIKSKRLYWLFGFCLVLLLTFCDRTPYPDYSEYYDGYLFGFDRAEFTFNAICSFAHLLNSFNVLLFVYAVIAVFTKLYVFQKITKRYWAAFAIYLSYYFLLHDIIQIRAGAASGFLLLAYYFFSVGKGKKSLLAILVGSCFHYSAIAGFVIYGLKLIKYNRKIFTIVLCCFLILGLVGILVLPEINSSVPIINYFMHYAGEEYQDEHGGINLLNVQQLVRYTICLLIMYKSKYALSSPPKKILFEIYFLGNLILCAFSIIPAIAFRAADLFYPLEIVILPDIVLRLKNKINYYGIRVTLVSRNSYVIYVLINLVITIFISNYLIF